jgi:hypothetical protein
MENVDGKKYGEYQLEQAAVERHQQLLGQHQPTLHHRTAVVYDSPPLLHPDQHSRHELMISEMVIYFR